MDNVLHFNDGKYPMAFLQAEPRGMPALLVTQEIITTTAPFLKIARQIIYLSLWQIILIFLFLDL